MALSVVCIVIVLLLGLLVIGLLRSHADILRALHSLGAGVDEVSSPTGAAAAGGHGQYVATPARRRPGGPVVVGPPLPHERQSDTASDVAGTSPDGAAVSIAATGVDQRTLFAFLTTGCVSCAGFWEAFEHGGPPSLPEGVRPVIVTKGPEHESPAVVAGRGGRVPVVMSTAAWSDYEVPGSPFFVLVDGPSSRRIGEGSAPEFAQIVGMVELYERYSDREEASNEHSRRHRPPSRRRWGRDSPLMPPTGSAKPATTASCSPPASLPAIRAFTRPGTAGPATPPSRRRSDRGRRQWQRSESSPVGWSSPVWRGGGRRGHPEASRCSRASLRSASGDGETDGP